MGGPTDFVRCAWSCVKLSKDHHTTIEEERYDSQT